MAAEMSDTTPYSVATSKFGDGNEASTRCQRYVLVPQFAQGFLSGWALAPARVGLVVKSNDRRLVVL